MKTEIPDFCLPFEEEDPDLHLLVESQPDSQPAARSSVIAHCCHGRRTEKAVCLPTLAEEGSRLRLPVLSQKQKKFLEGRRLRSEIRSLNRCQGRTFRVLLAERKGHRGLTSRRRRMRWGQAVIVAGEEVHHCRTPSPE
ncbi:hypothetical protein AAC387_Pa12g0490 [Persea americana]